MDGLNYILKLATELGNMTPLEGTTGNYVNLNRYVIGFELGLNMVNGKLDVWLMGQNPRS